MAFGTSFSLAEIKFSLSGQTCASKTHNCFNSASNGDFCLNFDGKFLDLSLTLK